MGAVEALHRFFIAIVKLRGSDVSPLLIALVLFFAVLIVLKIRKRKIRLRRMQFIDDFVFPQRIYQRIESTYPHLNENDIDLVITGLREYFHIVLIAKNKTVAMPSQVVDIAWHELILFTRDYQQFCNQAFGRFLHHTPAEAMTTPTQAQEGIKRAWYIACSREGIKPRKPDKLPFIFLLDSMLKINDGFTYQLDCLASKEGGYCASHIGCGGGCSGSSSDSDGCSGGGCGGD